MEHLQQRIQELKKKTQIDFEQYQDSELSKHILLMLDFDVIAILKKYVWLFLIIFTLLGIFISHLLQISFYQGTLYYSLSFFIAVVMSLLTVLKISVTKYTLSIFKIISHTIQFYAKIDFTKVSKETEITALDFNKGIIYVLILPVLKHVFVKKFYFVGKYLYRFYEWLIFKVVDYIEEKELVGNKVNIENHVKNQAGCDEVAMFFNLFLKEEFPKISLIVNIIYFACCATCLSFYTTTAFLIWLLKS